MKKEPDISVRLSRLILFHCHTALLRGFPAMQVILRYQLLNLRHNIFQFPILPDGKRLVLLPGEAQGVVDLGELFRSKKGVFLNQPAPCGEVPLRFLVMLVEIVSGVDALTIPIPFPGNEADAIAGGMPRQNDAVEIRQNTVVALQISCLELRRAFHHRHVLRSRFCDVDHVL